jgi:hypothetical protein
LHTIFPQVAIVFQKDHRDEMVDARALEAGQRRGARITCEVCGKPTITIAMEAERIDPPRAEKVIGMYSSLALKLVRGPASPPLHPRGAITMSSWSLMRANILLECPLVTFVVTLERR